MKHVHDLIPAYLDGRLDEHGRADLLRHCEACADCARALAESESVWELLGAVEVPAPSGAVWPAVEAATAGPRTAAWQRWSYPLAAAAALAAGVFIGSQLYVERDLTAWNVADEIVSGSLLSGDIVWTLDSALEEILGEAGNGGES